MSKLSGTDGNPEALTTGCSRNSRARYKCPTLVTGATRTRRSYCPVASGSSWSTTSGSLKCCWRATTFLCLGYSHVSSKDSKPVWKEQSCQPSESPILRQAAQQRNEQTDSSSAHCVCVNKTTKTWPSGISKKIISLKYPQRAGHNLEFYIQLNSFKNEYKLKTFSKGKRGSGRQQYTCTTKHVKRNSLSRRKTIQDGNFIYMKEER